MQSYKKFFESFEITNDSIYISPKTIYNFYFLYTYYQTRGVDQFSNFLVTEFSKNIKATYLRVFTKLVSKQLDKYQKRGRVDQDYSSSSDKAPTELLQLMKKTFRSDMKRRNDRWIELTEWMVKLESVNNIKDIFFVIDRINNTTHNTQEIILSKFENAASLLTVFDNCHEMKTLEQFTPYISKEYRQLL